jgi:hypothetical protein
VEHNGGLAVRHARYLPRDDVPIADIEHALVVRLNRRIEFHASVQRLALSGEHERPKGRRMLGRRRAT